MNEQLLACLVYSGMFSDEVAVKYKSKRTRMAVSSFVPKDRLASGQPSGTESPGKLKVRVFRDGGAVWAVLPNENQTIIEVDEADLQPT